MEYSLLVIIHVKNGSFAKPKPIYDYIFFLTFWLFCFFTDRMVTVGRWAKGMSADYEEILDVPKPQKPKTKTPKVVNFL